MEKSEDFINPEHLIVQWDLKHGLVIQATTQHKHLKNVNRKENKPKKSVLAVVSTSDGQTVLKRMYESLAKGWNLKCFELGNRVLEYSTTEPLSVMVNVTTPKVNIKTIKIGKNFQFAGDRYGVRHIVDIDGEFVLIKTLGHSNESGRYYIVHYSHLRKNESPVWDDDNNLRFTQIVRQ